LRRYENRLLRRIFVSKRQEVTGDEREIRNEELHNLHSSSNIDRYNDVSMAVAALHPDTWFKEGGG
jgi:hypothetical protein